MSGNSKSIIGKLKEEPLVPLGFVATIGAFLYAAHGVHRSNFKQSQWGMRGRVVAQGLTVAALFGYGMFRSVSGSKSVDKEEKQPIDWEKLERDALAAEAAEKANPTLSPLDKLIAKSNAQKAKRTIFAQEPTTEKKD
ncbi:Respiratory supercomplex factor 1, mitochondrial [Coemansia sp. Benny D115]|nr:Respiratory supercomplex factor 1, mitochondrial [Coemansia sp. Benny D115]